jgi:hypothetical protein
VHGFLDRHGEPRFYFRRAGFKKTPLPGLPWSPEFMAAYERAMAGQPLEIGSKRTIPGTMRALAVSYVQSAAFRNGLEASTQSVDRNIIERFCEEHGHKRAALLQHKHIVRLVEARADTPDSANGLRKVLRAMMQHAIDIGIRAVTRPKALRRSGASQRRAFTRGRRPRSRNSRQGTRSERSPESHWRLVFTPFFALFTP